MVALLILLDSSLILMISEALYDADNVFAQFNTSGIVSSDHTEKDFVMIYNFTDYVCTPFCIDTTAHYDSQTNELVSIDNLQSRESPAMLLNDEQENVLEATLASLRFNVDGGGICQIGTLYCVVESVTVMREGELPYTATWSAQTKNIITSLGDIIKTIISNDQISNNNMTIGT